MKVEGRLDIDLYRDAAQVREVTIRSTRPFQAVHLFHGKPVDQALETLPLLYSVCGTAQAAAAVAACEQAMLVTVSDNQNRARELLVQAETSREHMFRILLDWPTFADHPRPDAAQMGAMNALPRCLRNTIFPEGNPFQVGGAAMTVDRLALAACLNDARQFVEAQILNLSFDEWQAMDNEAALVAWAGGSDSIAAARVQMVMREGWSDFGRSTITGLPCLEIDALHERLSAASAEAFISQPQWQGASHETTALTRQSARQQALLRDLCDRHGNGLLPRLIARLHELVANIDDMRQLAETLEQDTGSAVGGRASGLGLSQVEAARGRLIHRVEITDGQIDRYQIVAPTEWNFHPRGLLPHALGGQCAADKDTLFKQTQLLVNAIDPCVDYRIQIH